MAKFCQNCGSPLTETSKFCEQCGTPVPQPAPEPAPQPTSQPATVPVPPPVQQPMPQPAQQPTLPNAATYPPPPAYPTAGTPGAYVTPPKKSRTGLLIAIIAAALVVLGVLAFFGFREGGFLRGGSSSPAAVHVKGDTEKHGYFKVLVPDGYTLSKGSILDETDPECFTLNSDSNYWTYFMFGLNDEQNAKDAVDVTREVNDGAKNVSVTYNDVTWTGVAYQSYGIDCFSLFADFGRGHYVLVSASGNAYDSEITNAVLSSLRVSAKAATETTTTEATTTTTTEPTTTTKATTKATTQATTQATTKATTKPTTKAAATGIDAVVGTYVFEGDFHEYFGETIVDSGVTSGTLTFTKSGSNLQMDVTFDDGGSGTFTLSYDAANMEASYYSSSESEIDDFTFEFYQSGGKMCVEGFMIVDYPYSDIPSDSYYFNGTRK